MSKLCAQQYGEVLWYLIVERNELSVSADERVQFRINCPYLKCLRGWCFEVGDAQAVLKARRESRVGVVCKWNRAAGPADESKASVDIT